jgi:excinuclease ABC subunit A
LNIPKEKLVVLTGVSGSGKSTLGFDILLKEGQRQYMEALGMLPFGMAKAEVEAISGLSPSVSIDQRLANHSPRSTVGTSTEVYTYLRVLFARLGYRLLPELWSRGPTFPQFLRDRLGGGARSRQRR